MQNTTNFARTELYTFNHPLLCLDQTPSIMSMYMSSDCQNNGRTYINTPMTLSAVRPNAIHFEVFYR